MNIFITGMTGFVGRAIAEEAQFRGLFVTGQAVHQMHEHFPTTLMSVNSDSNWSECLEHVDCVIHCAAHVHQMNDLDGSNFYREVNTFGTLNLAKQAAIVGVKRFVFVSSIKVNGEYTLPNQPYVEDVDSKPTDPYGISKYEAEQGLMALAKETSMEVVIIRPPLIYGPGVKANFLSMMNWIYKEKPLPLGAIKNQRSLIFVNNLVDFIFKAISDPKAANQTFLVSDDHDVSVTQLLKEIAITMNKCPMLIPIPQLWISALLRLLGKSHIDKKLTGSLQLDVTKAKCLLDWKPKYAFHEGIRLTVEHYLVQKEENKQK
ncbi:UDP-glucose 4-epimerase family protein [Vibrio nitrifigilis]|uniref:UDP-glucose 4-epimerase family protein n=1 Tax=Vibrio nitrifigilis TaxID=2789781 RepID=UPI0038B5781F